MADNDLFFESSSSMFESGNKQLNSATNNNASVGFDSNANSTGEIYTKTGETVPKTEKFRSSDSSQETSFMQKTAQETFHPKIVWRNVAIFTVLHIGAFYGLFLFMARAMWLTRFWAFTVHILGGLGITAGAHRLWAHRSFKAEFPLGFILVIWNSIAFQNDVIEWCRDHRCHHKWSETDADPHDARRGLFFSHMGWLMTRKHPEVKRRGKTVDISDLTQDPLLQLQRRYYLPSVFLFSFVVPSIVPAALWGESLWVGFYVAAVFRYAFTLHVTWTINSIAHKYGFRPYDRTINPRESYVSVVATLGEGYHNYHHTFPQDYKASEFPWRINVTTMFIDLCAQIGWAKDRKVISQEMVDERKRKNALKTQ